MKNAEKASNLKEGEVRAASNVVSNALASVIADLIRQGKVPLHLRSVIQFYLKNVAVFKARVLDNNRVTIPKEEVEVLGIEPGDYVVVILTKIEQEKGGE